MSDPRDPSRWSADDVISMGSLHTPGRLLAAAAGAALIAVGERLRSISATGRRPFWLDPASCQA